jgi:hypothetical protein
MRRRLIVLLILVTSSSLVTWVVARQRQINSIAISENRDSLPTPQVAILVNYKKWTLVNPVPDLMDPVSATACDYVRAHDSPHSNKYVSVYVNESGREAMMTQRKPNFPVGSVIVKEKLSSKTSTTPELLTAMVKREFGYDPANGDWEFLTLNGLGTEIKESGKLKNCQTCHSLYKHTDFITRSYLPLEVVQHLK